MSITREVERGELLRIDFAAALEKLALAQLQGSWQLPGELVRWALASGASAVDVELGRGRLELTAPGTKIADRTVQDFQAVLDNAAGAEFRHAALVRLEEGGALALAALAALAGASQGSCRIELQGPDGRLTMSQKGVPRLSPGGGDELQLTVRGLDFEFRRAARWLAQNGRFSPVPITLDRCPLRRGFHRSLIRVEFLRPLPAVVSIATAGEAPRLWLLRHGIIATRATVPGFPAFEAAIEMSSVVPPRATAALLREAVQPYLEKWIEAAVTLLLHLAAEVEKLPEETRQRVACLLLEAIRCRRRSSRVKRTPIFPQLDHGGRRWLSMNDVTRLAAASPESGTLEVAPPSRAHPGHEAGGFFGSGRRGADRHGVGRPVLVVSAAERALLGEVLEIRFHNAPPRLRSARPWRRRFVEWGGNLAFLWHQLAGHLLSPAELQPVENEFLAAFTAAPAGWPRAVALRRGSGPSRMTSDGRLLLARSNSTVTAAMAAVGRDPDMLYPALLALLEGHALPAPELRERWLAKRAAGLATGPAAGIKAAAPSAE